jgi:hypothetical protein
VRIVHRRARLAAVVILRVSLKSRKHGVAENLPLAYGER